jgi:hypothetical protein
MKKLLVSLFAMVMLACLTPGLHADADDWVLLGESHVDGQHDHDNISVGKEKGKFSHLRINVEKEAIEFDHIVVHYGDGQAETLHVRNKIRAGDHTRAIELDGTRYIESLELWYSRVHKSSDKPEVKLWGEPAK